MRKGGLSGHLPTKAFWAVRLAAWHVLSRSLPACLCASTLLHAVARACSDAHSRNGAEATTQRGGMLCNSVARAGPKSGFLVHTLPTQLRPYVRGGPQVAAGYGSYSRCLLRPCPSCPAASSSLPYVYPRLTLPLSLAGSLDMLGFRSCRPTRRRRRQGRPDGRPPFVHRTLPPLLLHVTKAPDISHISLYVPSRSGRVCRRHHRSPVVQPSLALASAVTSLIRYARLCRSPFDARVSMRCDWISFSWQIFHRFVISLWFLVFPGSISSPQVLIMRKRERGR